MKYGFRPHRGGLQESLKEKKYMSKKDFYKILDCDNTYDFYGFDNRCNQLLFLNSEYNWLFIELDNFEKLSLSRNKI